MKKARTFGLWAAAGLLLIQAVPYGRHHTNPGISGEPAWSEPRVRELFLRTCADCHSNETRWPWYSHVAPASWLVQRDVDEARAHFNVSEWGRADNAGDEAAEELEGGDMPPWFYLPLHAEARLSEAERSELIAGLRSTFGASGEAGERPD